MAIRGGSHGYSKKTSRLSISSSRTSCRLAPFARWYTERLIYHRRRYEHGINTFDTANVRLLDFDTSTWSDVIRQCRYTPTASLRSSLGTRSRS